jgi:flagellar assembly factor FliW
MTLHVDGTRFGAIEVDPDKIIEFPRGLPGFEDLRRFALLHPEQEGGEKASYFILQSVDDPAVAFHVADPARLGFNYEIELADEDAALIQLGDPAKAAVVVILVEGGAGAGVRANLNSPLVINLDARLGVQHMFHRLDYKVTLKGN